jgi:uncharacterized protein (TIGR03545 family)
MKKFLRLWGLLAFIIIISVFSVAWIVFADRIVRRSIESSAEIILETNVDIKKAEITLAPLSVNLQKIQIADKSDRSFNRAEVEDVSFTVDANSLLERKVIIDEMRMNRLRFGTRRAPEDISAVSESRTKLPTPKVELPSIQEILEKEHIKSFDVIELSLNNADVKLKALKREINDLPDDKVFNAHKQKTQELVEKIRSKGLTGVLVYADEISILQAEVSSDIKQYQVARRNVERLVKQVESDRNAVEATVQEDVRKIKLRYGSIQQAAFSFSEALFGAEFRQRIETGLAWYKRLEPFIGWMTKKIINGLEIVEKPDGRGIDVRFQENNPRPDFYIGNVKLDMEHSIGLLAGQIMHLTADQHITGQPITFDFSGKEMKTVDRILFNGAIDRVNPDKLNDVISLDVSGLRLKDLSVVTAEGGAIKMVSGQTDLRCTVKNDGKQLSGQINMQFVDTRFASSLYEGKKGAAHLQKLLDSVSAFSLTARLSGSADSWQLKIESDLDEKFNEYFKATVAEEVRKFESDLENGIRSGLKGKLADLNLASENINKLLDQVTANLTDREKILNTLSF